ncbi:unnamed protein product [Trypanosoma congolense IL3000]|uniref:Putative ubiquitin-protein ligase n=1 Tax=Trypanosoma congolense (strain IL3000) TaxID=1068625 RepID=F9W809_TRYCI|nr:putative ubiquitin-protein ligase [Trypanosoma congolense IL3000]CCD13333.1 unnamed protein product [Trypanosoma congolense IL3000]
MAVTMKNCAASMRLQKEFMEMMSCDADGISAFPVNDNLFHWVGTMQGAADTAYEGLEYKLCIEFPPNYPFSAPYVRFMTPCFHPNVDSQGNICLDILKDKWSAVYSITKVLLSIQSLLGNPNNQSPLNSRAATMWNDQAAFRAEVVAYRETKGNASC